ncbi:hypothetical protein JMJ77_0003202, partial [Colletotrichum scovillei]
TVSLGCVRVLVSHPSQPTPKRSYSGGKQSRTVEVLR